MAEEKYTKILEIQLNYEDAVKGIAEYEREIRAARSQQNQWRHELSDLEKDFKNGRVSVDEYEASQKRLTERIVQSQTATKELRYEQGVIQKQLQQQVKIEEANEGSLVSLRAELSNLTAQYDALSRAEREGARGKELENHINAVTKELKDAEAATQRYYRNVGNYTNAMIEAASANIPFVNTLKSITPVASQVKDYFSGVNKETKDIIKSFKEAQAETVKYTGAKKTLAVATNVASAAFKVFKVALVSTGIGAMVIALGSLISYLTKTQKGVELASKVMESLGAAINVVVDRLSVLGGAIIKVFSGDFKGAFNDVKSAFSGIGTEIADETAQAWKLKEALIEVDKAEVMLSMKRASNKSLIADLKKIADDTTKSEKERIEAAKEAIRLEAEDLDNQTKLEEARLANILGYTEVTDEVRKTMQEIKDGALSADEAISRLGLNDSTLSDLKEFRDVFNNIQNLNEQSAGKQKELNNKVNSIRKEGASKSLQIEKERSSKEKEAIRAAEDAMLALLKDNNEKRKQEISLQYSREIEDLKNKLVKEKNLTAAARDAITQTIAAKEQQQAQALADLDAQISAEAIQRQQERIQLMLETVKHGTEQEYQLRLDQNKLNMEADLAATEQEIQNLEEREQMKALIRAKYAEQEHQITIERREAVAEEERQAIENEFTERLMQVEENSLESAQIELERRKYELDNLHQMEGESNAAFIARQLEARKAYNDQKKKLADAEVQIELAKDKAIASLMGTVGDAITQLAGDNKAAAQMAKVIGMAELWINQAVALSEAIKSASTGDPYTTAARIAAAVASVVVGMASAFSSMSQAKFAHGGKVERDNYATGGSVKGAGTGTSDSIPAWLSNGEFVMTAAATKIFQPQLEAMNAIGRGVVPPTEIQRVSISGMNDETFSDSLAASVAEIRPVVSVVDINEGINRVEAIDTLDTL